MKCAPGWKEIDHTAKEAQAKVDNKRLDTRHEYCTGVWECLGWINGDLPKPPKL